MAGEVASFGIKVTIIEPGSYSTGFGHATEMAPGMPEYQPLRKTVHASFSPDVTGDPEATASAILKLVDADEPPLRLILGDWLLPMFKQVYQGRIDTWEQWAAVSNAAQGRAN